MFEYSSRVLEPYSSEVVWIVVLGFIMAFVLAFGLGANDVANSFGTSVGSKVLTLRQACTLATVFETAGAVLIGYKVSDTIRKGILELDMYHDNEKELMLGMFATLIGASAMLIGATFFGLPVSATHSTVGATVGFSLVCRGFRGLDWMTLGTIVSSWFLSPVLSGLISVLLFLLIRRFILNSPTPLIPGLQSLPLIYGVTIFVNVFSIVHDGSSMLYFDRIPWWGVLILSLGLGGVIALLVHVFLVPRMRNTLEGNENTTFSGTTKCDDAYIEDHLGKQSIKMTDNGDKEMPNGNNCEPNGNVVNGKEVAAVTGQDNPAFTPSPDDTTNSPTPEDKKAEEEEDTPVVHRLFSFLQILTASFASFAHGGNDVSNAIGPLIALWQIFTEGSVEQKSETPLYLLFYGGVGISIGLWVWGRRVIKTIGESLTKITPSTGFTIEIGAAITVLLASKLGMPISTTHCKVGSIVFVGWASTSKKGVDWLLFRNIFGAWVITVPVAAGVSAAVMAMLREVVL